MSLGESSRGDSKLKASVSEPERKSLYRAGRLVEGTSHAKTDVQNI